MALTSEIENKNELDCLRAIVQGLYNIGAAPVLNSNRPAQSRLETGTTPLTGNFSAILIVTNAVFTLLGGMSGDSVAGVTFPAGVTLYGNFTAVTLASGSIVLYTLPS